jgi:hypothetical protein
MSYDPNGPLAVRPIEQWFDQQRHGFVICDAFVQAGVEDAPKQPLEPGEFPAAFTESEIVGAGIKFLGSATDKFPDLEIGVLITEGNHPDDLNGGEYGELIDEFEDGLVAAAGFVGYGLGNRFETDAETATTGRRRHEYGQRVEAAGQEFGVPVFNFDPLIIPGFSMGGTEDLLADMDDKVRALAFQLGREHGLVKAAMLHARHMWQIHALGKIGVHLDAMEHQPQGPGLVVVSKDHLGLYPKLSAAIGDPADQAPQQQNLDVAEEEVQGPRVGLSPMHQGVLPEDDTAWDDAAVMERGYITKYEAKQ